MTVTLAPRAAAQKAADQIKKLATNHWEGGKWHFHEEQNVVLLDPPGHAFLFAFHLDSLSLFRSASRNTSRLCSSSLRTVIDPYRTWIVNAMKNIVPCGQDFLAYERGDQDVMKRRANALRATKQSTPEPVPVPSFSQPPSQPTKPAIDKTASQESFSMALLDIQKSTRRMIVEEVSETLELNRNQLVAILRAAGASSLKKDVKISLVDSTGDSVSLTDGCLKLEWTVTTEKEESC
jgi:hypothetical protein